MEIRNHLLCEFPEDARQSLLRAASRHALTPGRVLQAQGDPERYCYFLESGLVSLSRLQKEGERLEAGLIGREGMVGSLEAPSRAFTEARVEVGGEALRIELAIVSATAATDVRIADVIARYRRFQLEEAQLNAACNATHAIEARLSKWLLRCLDRLDGPLLELRQDFVAEMLGVQRTTITAALGRMAERGAVKTGRGSIAVTNRSLLEARACECYELTVERLPELGFPTVADESACAA